MAYYQNWFTRFVLRKDFFRRVGMRLDGYKRTLSKDEFDDLGFLLQGHQPNVVFDCGANVGFVTHRFLQLFPEARVYAFEPNPIVYSKLVETYKADSRVRPHQMAISRREGRMTFNQNPNTGVSSFFQPTAYNKSNWARKPALAIEVEVTSIDGFMAKEGIQIVDVLKLDLEGSEMDALIGADRLLTEQQAHVIYTEINLVPFYQEQKMLEDVVLYLRAKGYSLYNLYGFNETPIRQATFGNATFLSAKFRDSLTKQWGREKCGW